MPIGNLRQKTDGAVEIQGAGPTWYDIEFQGPFTAAGGANLDTVLQLRSAEGAILQRQVMLSAFIWNASENPITTTTPPVSLTILEIVTQGTRLAFPAANVMVTFLTNSLGKATVRMQTTTNTRKLIVLGPDGMLRFSPTLTWT